MDTYLYGLLGVSLAANAFSFIGSLVTSSKKRDDENQKTISGVYEEMNKKIDSEISGLRFEMHSQINDVRREFNDNIDTLSTMIEDLTDKVYESQDYDLENYTGTKGKTKVSRKSKKRN